jgi:FLVCR family MFS transporter 7
MDKNIALPQVTSVESYLDQPPSSTPHRILESPTTPPKTYRRRYVILAQLSLLNIVVSWCWLTFAPVSSTSATYFNVSINSINWLSTGFLFAFVAATPATLWTLNKHGPRGAIIAASVLIAIGSWIRYAGTKAGEQGHFGVVVLGQVLIGLAQPFVLAAPTRFSEMWFTERGRIAATAVASLCNPFGGALGQLINPFWCTKPGDVPNMVLYVAIISTISTIPTLFLPAEPPTPPSTIAVPIHPPLTRTTLQVLLRNPTFPLLALPFAIYVSAFNATSSLLVPILAPHDFSETASGIAGALLIVVGLISSAVTSPILDRHPSFRIPVVKTLVPVIAICYMALIWVPSTSSVVGVYLLMSILGAASFSLVPLALEMLVDVSGPEVGAEVSSSLCWSAGQLGGGVIIVVMDALQMRDMQRGCIFQAVICLAIVPAPLCLGLWGTGGGIGKRGMLEDDEREEDAVLEDDEREEDVVLLAARSRSIS